MGKRAHFTLSCVKTFQEFSEEKNDSFQYGLESSLLLSLKELGILDQIQYSFANSIHKEQRKTKVKKHG